MIKAIIFDLGDVFIDLEIQKSKNAFRQMGITAFDSDLQESNALFEIGIINEKAFLENFQKKIPTASLNDIKSAWNLIIGNFPEKRLEFLCNLSKKYPLYLLSNTDQIHIAFFKQKVGSIFYNKFENCFQKIYFSFEMGLRKPDLSIFKKVINDQNLLASEALFIDDRIENIESAKKIGIQTWHLIVDEQDVTELYDYIDL